MGIDEEKYLLYLILIIFNFKNWRFLYMHKRFKSAQLFADVT